MRIGETRVGKLLVVMNPHYLQRRRRNTAQAVNPIMCKADYFKHKLHLHQNETLAIYGATQFAAINGRVAFSFWLAMQMMYSGICIYT